MSDEEFDEDLTAELSEGLDSWLQQLKDNFPCAQVEIISPKDADTGKSLGLELLESDKNDNDLDISDVVAEHHNISISEHNYSRSVEEQEKEPNIYEEEGVSEHLDRQNVEDEQNIILIHEEAVNNIVQHLEDHNVTLEHCIDHEKEIETVDIVEDKDEEELNAHENEQAVVNGLGRVVAKRRKRGCPEQWADTRNKRLRETGEVYVGWSKPKNSKGKRGKVREKREIGERCNGCRKSTRTCNEISEEDRKVLFNDFWKNLTWNQKQIYVASLVKCELKKTARNKDKESRRKSSLTYTIKTPNGKVHHVCKTFFLGTFALGEWTVKTGLLI